MPQLTSRQSLLIDQVSGAVPVRKPVPNPRASLSVGQKILTNPVVSKTIDTLAGIIPENQRTSGKEFLKSIPYGGAQTIENVGGLVETSQSIEHKLVGSLIRGAVQPAKEFYAPKGPPKFLEQVGSGIGSTIPTMATGFLGGMSKAAPLLRLLVPSVTESAIEAGGTAMEARETGKPDQEAALKSFLMNVPITMAGNKFSGLFDEKAGLVRKLLGGLVEGPQEGAQQAAGNIALKKPVMQGVPEATAVGSVVGPLMGSGVGALQNIEESIKSGAVRTPSGILKEKRGSTEIPSEPEKPELPPTKPPLIPENPPVALPKPAMFLEYDGKQYPIQSAKEASEKWDMARNEMMKLKGPEFGPNDLKHEPFIVDSTGNKLGYVSWNSSVWKGEPGGKREQWIDSDIPDPAKPQEKIIDTSAEWEAAENMPSPEVARDASEFEGVTDKAMVKDLSDFVSNMEPGQGIMDFEGNYSRLSSGFAPEFSNRGYTKKYLHNIYDKYVSGTKLTEKQAGDLLYTLNAYKQMVGVKPSDTIPDVVTIQSLRQSKLNDKFVRLIGKHLSSKMPSSKVKGQIIQSTGQVKTETPIMATEESLLKRELGQEQIAAKAGEKQGIKFGVARERNLRSNIISELKREGKLNLLRQDILSRDEGTAERATLQAKYDEEIADLKRKGELDIFKQEIKHRDRERGTARAKSMVTQYAKDNLPLESRGKFITAVQNSESFGDVIHSFRQIDKEVSNIERKSIIENIRKDAGEAISSEQVDVKHREDIKEILEGIEFTKRRPETMDKIRQTQEYIDSQKAIGKDVEMPERILKKLKILTRKPISEMSTAELKNVQEDIKDFIELGKRKLKSRKEIYELQKSRRKEEIINGTVPVEKNPLLQPEPGGKRLTIMDRLKNTIPNLHNAVQDFDLTRMFQDTVFDFLDGGNASYDGANYRNFKKRQDTNYHSYLNRVHKIVTPVIDMVKDLKIDQVGLERIGIHAARMQEGGRQKLIDTGMTDKQIDNIVLTEKEERVYKAMRKALDEYRPEIERILRDHFNMSLDKVKNYFSFMTDFEKTNQRRIQNRVFQDDADLMTQHKTKTIEKGFAQKRTFGTQAIKLNALEIFSNHIDNAVYLVEMARDNQMLFEIANSPEYRKAAGSVGQEIVLDWLDLMSRKGGIDFRLKSIAVDYLRKNFGASVMGFNASSILIQPTALLDGAALIGSDAFSGLIQTTFSKEKRMFVLDNMPELRNRVDDPIYKEFQSDDFLTKAQRAGYFPLRFLDAFSATGVAYGAYQKKIREMKLKVDLSNPNKEAVEYAQMIVRQSQSTGQFKDLPLLLSKGKGVFNNRSMNRALFHFQTFVLKRFETIKDKIFRANILGGRTKDASKRNMKEAAMGISFLIMAYFLEAQIRRKIKEIINSAFGNAEKPKTTLTHDMLQSMLTTIPLTSPLVSALAYGSDPIASWSSLQDLGRAGTMFTGKEPETKIKARIAVAEGVGSIVGVPGTGMAAKLARSAVTANTQDNVIEIYKQAITENDKAKEEKADTLAIKMGLSKKRMKEKAQSSLKRKETGFVSDLEEKLHNKSDEEFNVALNKMFKDGSLSAKGAGKVKALREKRIKEESKIKREVEEQTNPKNRISSDSWKAIESLMK